jgi:hypothetical protein
MDGNATPTCRSKNFSTTRRTAGSAGVSRQAASKAANTWRGPMSSSPSGTPTVSARPSRTSRRASAHSVSARRTAAVSAITSWLCWPTNWRCSGPSPCSRLRQQACRRSSKRLLMVSRPRRNSRMASK